MTLYINQLITMLGRYINKSMSLVLRRTAAFSGGHDDHHHSYNVQVDKDHSWIKYKSNPKLAFLQGVQDTNYPLQPLEGSDPFEHIRNSPFFSFNRLVYTNDPWHHDDSHEIYNSAPERGYVNGEDPLQTRFLYTIPMLVSLCMIGTVLILYGFADLRFGNSEAILYNQKDARDYVFDTLGYKNRLLNSLKAKEAELLQSSSQ